MFSVYERKHHIDVQDPWLNSGIQCIISGITLDHGTLQHRKINIVIWSTDYHICCFATEAYLHIGITLSSICQSGSHTFLVFILPYASQATHIPWNSAILVKSILEQESYSPDDRFCFHLLFISLQVRQRDGLQQQGDRPDMPHGQSRRLVDCLEPSFRYTSTFHWIC